MSAISRHAIRHTRCAQSQISRSTGRQNWHPDDPMHQHGTSFRKWPIIFVQALKNNLLILLSLWFPWRHDRTYRNLATKKRFVVLHCAKRNWRSVASCMLCVMTKDNSLLYDWAVYASLHRFMSELVSDSQTTILQSQNEIYVCLEAFGNCGGNSFIWYTLFTVGNQTLNYISL